MKYKIGDGKDDGIQHNQSVSYKPAKMKALSLSLDFSNHNDKIQAVHVFTLKSNPCFSVLEVPLAVVFVFT